MRWQETIIAAHTAVTDAVNQAIEQYYAVKGGA